MSQTMKADAIQDGMTAERGVGEHTPGLRVARYIDLDDCTKVVAEVAANFDDDAGETLYVVTNGPMGSQGADAALYASAPDLLEALQQALRAADGETGLTTALREQMRAAVAKAQGGAA